MSIEYDLGLEAARFCAGAPWPDVIPTNDSLKQLPLLSQFFDVEREAQLIDSSENTEFLVGTLGTILASLLPMGFKQFLSQGVIRKRNRRAQLRLQAIAKMSESLSQKFVPTVVPVLEKAITKEASKVKGEIKKAGGSKDITLVIESRLAKLTQVKDTGFFDMTEIDPSSVAWRDRMTVAKQNEHAQHLARITKNETHSRSVLDEMIVTGQS